jgi:hypothetical protein
MTKKFAKWFTNYESQESYGSKLRKKRILPLLEIIEEIFRQKGTVKIIDLGGTEKYWGIVSSQFLIDHNVNITIVNLPGGMLPENHGLFSFVGADACDLNGFEDNSFDIGHSNSVLEHVGDWGRKVRFAEEISRVSRNYFVQTPNYWFPIEPHFMTPFFNWLPEPIRVWLVLNYQLGNMNKANSINDAVKAVESARLLNKKMFQALFKDADFSTETFIFLPKSFIAIKKDRSV